MKYVKSIIGKASAIAVFAPMLANLFVLAPAPCSADNELFNSWVSMAKDSLGIDGATVASILKAAEE